MVLGVEGAGVGRAAHGQVGSIGACAERQVLSVECVGGLNSGTVDVQILEVWRALVLLIVSERAEIGIEPEPSAVFGLGVVLVLILGRAVVGGLEAHGSLLALDHVGHDESVVRVTCDGLDMERIGARPRRHRRESPLGVVAAAWRWCRICFERRWGLRHLPSSRLERTAAVSWSSCRF